MKSIIGKKVGMTSIFDTNGRQTAVTIIEAGPCVVTQKKTVDTDGYNAVQIAFGDKKEKHTLLSEKNHFAKANTPAKKFVKEIRDSETDKNIGETITVDIFTEGDKVVVIGTTKGKGFQGVVKRHGFHGVGEQSHGQHDRSRAPGSIGGLILILPAYLKVCAWAAVWDSDKVQIKGLKVVKIFPEKNYILISGSVPGHNGSIVLIQK